MTRPPYLEHLTGSRFLAIVWVMLSHRSRQTSASDAVPLFIERVPAAVSYFVVMSGFVTHYTSSQLSFGDRRGLLGYYVRRLDRVLLVSWICLLFDLLVMPASDRARQMGWGLVPCFLQVASWNLGPSPHQCPNVPNWTVGSLLLCWLLFPALQLSIAAAARRLGTAGVLALTVSPWAITLAGIVWVYVAQGGTFTAQDLVAYGFPPMWLGDFALGCGAAA